MARKRKGKSRKDVQLPPLLAAGIAVPVLAGYALVAWVTSSMALGFLGAIMGGLAYWGFLPRLKGMGKDTEKPSHTPDDILESILIRYQFETCETADPRRPEAISLDGTRWSQLMKFTTPEGDSDTFMVRSSLVTGEATLEFVEGVSQYTPEDWEPVLTDNPSEPAESSLSGNNQAEGPVPQSGETIPVEETVALTPESHTLPESSENNSER